MRKVLLLCLLALTFSVQALQVTTLEVTRDAAVYHVVVDVKIAAAPARVRERLLDVSLLPQLDPSITAARVVENADGRRVETDLEECLFGICRQLLHVEQVSAVDNEITAVTLPVPGSSFKSGIAHWQLRPDGDGTHMLFTADTEPDVWLPPFIGPRALMQKLRKKTLTCLETLERLASD